MLFHYIHHHKKYHAIFRYYYDESEDDIDDYSRKPVFHQWYMRICRIYIVDFLSAQNHNKLQKVLSIMIKPLIRFQSYFQSCSSSSTLLAGLSFSKCGRGGPSWTGSPIPTLPFVTSALSFPPSLIIPTCLIIPTSSAPTSASSLWRPLVSETWPRIRRWRTGRRGSPSAPSTSSLASPWLPWASTWSRRRYSSRSQSSAITSDT